MARRNAIIFSALVTGSLALSMPAAPAAPVSEKPSPVESARPAPERALIPAGTPLRVRLNSSLDTRRSRPGDRFTGVLAAPIIMNGRTVLPSGANVEGVVRTATPSGRLKGRAHLSIALISIENRGTKAPLSTDAVTANSGAHKKRNLTLIGGGSGLGALIGGLAGGPAGALIGAGAGAGAGTAGAAVTGKKQAHISAESVVIFHLRQPLPVRG